MKRTVSSLAAVAGLIAGLSTGAAAGVTPEQFSIGPFIGGYAFDSTQNYKGAFTAGGRLGYDFTKRFGAELGLGIAFPETKDPGSEHVNVTRYGVDLLYHLVPDGRLDPYLAAGVGGIKLGEEDGAQSTSRTAFDYGIGARYYLNDDIALRADVRHIMFSDGSTRNNLEYTAGVTFFFGGLSSCGCPTPVKEAPAPPPPAPTPPPAPAPPPPAPPTAQLSAMPAAIMSEQVAQLNWSSQNATSCVIQPEVGTVEPQGSRVISPKATTTYTIDCQGAGGTAQSSTLVTVKAPPPPTCTIAANPATVMQGSPSTLTWSSQNATSCDLQPGIGAVQPQGSVTVTPAAETVYTLNCQGKGGAVASTSTVAVTIPPPEKPCKTMTLDVKFDTAKADIKSQYEGELETFAGALKENPKATAVIEGHTDNVGDADMNMKLSQRRADSIRTFLIDKLGIAAERLTAKGYGLTKPVASNKTKEGKSQNRRIDALIFCNK